MQIQNHLRQNYFETGGRRKVEDLVHKTKGVNIDKWRLKEVSKEK